MPGFKKLLVSFLTLIIVLSFVVSSFGQVTIRKKRRVAEEKFRKVEIYFDGGYSLFNMSDAEDAHAAGLAGSLNQFMAYSDYEAVYFFNGDSGARYQEQSASFENVRSMGGGINYNFSERLGISMNIQFLNLEAKTVYHQYYSDVQLTFQNIGSVIIDQDNIYTCNSKYSYRPIVFRAYYRMNNFAALPGLTTVIGGGPGLYITTVEIDNSAYQVPMNYPALLNLNTNFARFQDRFVAQPIGLHLFAGFQVKGSSVVSFNFGAELNFVPKVKIGENDWWQGENFEHTFGLDNDDEIREIYLNAFKDFRPKEINLTNFRLNASIQFAF